MNNMDLGEFEFDLSNVAAFESVATEDPIQEQQQQLQNLQPPQPPPPPQPPTPMQTNTDEELQQLVTPQPSQTSQDSDNHNQQATPTPTPTHQQQQQTRILLVPINPGKQSTTGYKQLYQLATLTTSANKKQIIQLAPLPTSTNQVLTPSQTLKQQPHQLYIKQQPSSQLHQQLQQQHQQLQQQQQQQNQSLNKSILPDASNEVPKRKPCNCTKSQCLKLYCDCFANGEFCSGCNCTNCFNSLSKEKERQKAISQCLERNPEAFRPKIGKAVKSSVGEPAPELIERRHTKGCNCKRSGCLKNYCECYEAKILCSNLCKCCGCKNYEESFERKSLMQLANSASENARGILKNLLPTNTNSSTGREFTKCFITDKVIHASLVCLLQSAQQAEKDGIQDSKIPELIQSEMGRCLRMIVDSATETSSPKKR